MVCKRKNCACSDNVNAAENRAKRDYVRQMFLAAMTAGNPGDLSHDEVVQMAISIWDDTQEL